MRQTYSSQPYRREMFDKLEGLGVVEKGHFVDAKTGRHEIIRAERGLLFPSATSVRDFTEIISLEFLGDSMIDTFIGAGPEGAILASHLADWVECATGRSTHAIYCEKVQGRALGIPKPQQRFVDSLTKVVIVTGILDDGFAEGQMRQMVYDRGGELWGIAAIWNPVGLTARDMAVPNLFSVCDQEFTSWEAADCPLCEDKVPITK